MMAIAWARPRLNARRKAQNAPLVHGPLILEASDHGMHFTSGVEDSQVSWSAFVGWAEGNAVFAFISEPAHVFSHPEACFHR